MRWYSGWFRPHSLLPLLGHRDQVSGLTAATNRSAPAGAIKHGRWTWMRAGRLLVSFGHRPEAAVPAYHQRTGIWGLQKDCLVRMIFTSDTDRARRHSEGDEVSWWRLIAAADATGTGTG